MIDFSGSAELTAALRELRDEGELQELSCTACLTLYYVVADNSKCEGTACPRCKAGTLASTASQQADGTP